MRRDIDADLECRQSRPVPDTNLAAGFAEYPTFDIDDQSGFLGDPDECIGENDLTLVAPTQQDLHADQFTALNADLRLIFQEEFVTGEGLSQCALHVQAVVDVIRHFLGEK